MPSRTLLALSPRPEVMPKVLVFNSLDDRYGSTFRIRAISKGIGAGSVEAIYIEAPKSIVGKFWIAFKTFWKDYDLLFTQKFNPVTLVAMIGALIKRKPVVVDWDDIDADLQDTKLKR